MVSSVQNSTPMIVPQKSTHLRENQHKTDQATRKISDKPKPTISTRSEGSPIKQQHNELSVAQQRTQIFRKEQETNRQVLVVTDGKGDKIDQVPAKFAADHYTRQKDRQSKNEYPAQTPKEKVGIKTA